MATLRTHVALPTDLANDIDQLAGPRGRSAFLVESAEKEVRRRKLLAFAQSNEPVWRDEDHPDLVELGTAEWVRRQRETPSVRLEGRDDYLQSQTDPAQTDPE